MSRDQNVASQQSLADNINAHDIPAAVRSFAEDAVDHDPAPDQGPGRAGFQQFWETLTAAFPDVHLEPQHLVADDDSVAVALTITGTHDGEFEGVAPTGKRIEVRGVQVARFEDGVIVERWGTTDQLSIMQQIGAVGS